MSDRNMPSMKLLSEVLKKADTISTWIEEKKQLMKHERWEGTVADLQTMNTFLDYLYDEVGAINSAMYDELTNDLAVYKRAVENRDRTKAKHTLDDMQRTWHSEVMDSIAMWARAPRLVGAKRKITE